MERGIHLGDTKKLILYVEQESIDCIITDPPYGMDYQSNQRTSREQFDKIQNDVGEDWEELIKLYLQHCYRILKDDSAIYCFCGWQTLPFMRSEFEEYFTLKNIIIWDKMRHGMGDLEGAYAGQYEMILFGHKGRHTKQGDYRYPDVLRVPKIDPSKLVHPNEKPPQLLEIFLYFSTNKGDLVFDGFAGSGSIVTACKKLERDYLVFEIEPEYIDIIKERETNSIPGLF